jgi:hypothetical protein
MNNGPFWLAQTTLLIAFVILLAACAGPKHVTHGGMDKVARDWTTEVPYE